MPQMSKCCECSILFILFPYFFPSFFLLLSYFFLILGVRSLANACRARQFNPLNPPGVGQIFLKVRVSIRTCVPNLGAVRRERFLTIYYPLNPSCGGGGQIFFKVKVSIRTCGPNLGVVRRSPHTSQKHHTTNPHTHKQTSHIPQTSIDNPLTPSGVGWVIFFGESQSHLYPHMRAKFGRGPTAVSKKVSFKFISRFIVILYYLKFPVFS